MCRDCGSVDAPHAECLQTSTEFVLRSKDRTLGCVHASLSQNAMICHLRVCNLILLFDSSRSTQWVAPRENSLPAQDSARPQATWLRRHVDALTPKLVQLNLEPDIQTVQAS